MLIKFFKVPGDDWGNNDWWWARTWVDTYYTFPRPCDPMTILKKELK